MRNDELEKVFLSLGEIKKNKKESEDEEVIKLAFLYFLEHVLFGKGGKNLIDMEWVALVDNLEAFNKYPLGRRGDLLWDDTIWFAKSFGEPGIQIPR